jgi:hypothetical protein
MYFNQDFQQYLIDEFKLKEIELEKTEEWKKHTTLDVAKIMIEIGLKKIELQIKPYDEYIFSHYNKKEDQFLDDCDWVVQMQTETIASFVTESFKKEFPNAEVVKGLLLSFIKHEDKEECWTVFSIKYPVSACLYDKKEETLKAFFEFYKIAKEHQIIEGITWDELQEEKC